MSRITTHEFEVGDHAYIEADHSCHDCGRPLGEHANVPAYVADIIIPEPAPMICPTCSGALEQRRERDWTSVFACTGTCRTVWSLFDLVRAKR